MCFPKLVCDRCASRMEVPQTVFLAGILQFLSSRSVFDGNTHVRVRDSPHGDIFLIIRVLSGSPHSGELMGEGSGRRE